MQQHRNSLEASRASWELGSMAVARQRFAHIWGQEWSVQRMRKEQEGGEEAKVSGLLLSVRPHCDRFIPAEREGNAPNGTIRSDKRQARPQRCGNG